MLRIDDVKITGCKLILQSLSSYHLTRYRAYFEPPFWKFHIKLSFKRSFVTSTDNYPLWAPQDDHLSFTDASFAGRIRTVFYVNMSSPYPLG